MRKRGDELPSPPFPRFASEDEKREFHDDEEMIITRHGRPAGVLIGLRVAAARTALRRGKGVRLEDLAE